MIYTTPKCVTTLERGIQLHNARYQSKSKYRIDLTLKDQSRYPSCLFEELVEEVSGLRDKRNDFRSARRKRLDDAILNINKHAKVVDVLIQQQPDITAIVWGTLRYLINITASELDTSDKISKALVQIVTSLCCWGKYAELFDTFEAVNRAAAELFSHIICFLVHARIYYQKRKIPKFLKLGLTTYSSEFDNMIDLIQEKEKLLKKEADLASMCKLEQDRKVQAAHFEDTFKKLDRQMDLQLAATQDRNDQKRDLLLKRLNEIRHHPVLEPAVEGTGCWILQTTKWQNWSKDSYSMPLVITGAPGSGKSVLMHCLTEATTNGVNLSYFFQKSINSDKATASCFMAGMLYQMLKVEEIDWGVDYQALVEQALEVSNLLDLEGDSAYTPLWNIVLKFLPLMSNVLLIVDGLNECKGKDKAKLCTSLFRLASLPEIRIVVSFQPQPYLDELFQACPQVELTPQATFEDIERYIASEIVQCPKKLSRIGPELFEVLRSNGDAVFLHVRMILTTLKAKITYDEQINALKEPPAELFSSYESAMKAHNESLPEEYRERQKDIFTIVVGSRQALTCDELASALALHVDVSRSCMESEKRMLDPQESIIALCGPLIRVLQGTVSLIHGSVKDFLIAPPNGRPAQLTIVDSDAYLAEKTLAALSQQRFQSLDRIAFLLRGNVDVQTNKDDVDPFYQYAATHWYVHLTAVMTPKAMLLEQAEKFLHGKEFVSWSEFVFQLKGSQGGVLEVRSTLNLWKQSLHDGAGDVLTLADYFEKPYRDAANMFQEMNSDKTLQYLCQYQLGEYFNLAGRIVEAFSVKKAVSEGLVKLLGQRHPLALKAQSAFALEYLGQRRFEEAEAEFRRLSQVQREVIGTERPDCFQSQQRQAMAELWMTKFDAANMNLEESLSGFLNTVGVRDFLYLMSELTMGQVFEYEGQVARASRNYERIWEYRRSVFGPDNPMAVWARCALVSAYRKLGRFAEAHRAIDDVIDTRTRILGTASSMTVDALIQEVVLFLDEGKLEEGMEAIDYILDGDLVEGSFERTVQVKHVLAVLDVSLGKPESASQILSSLVKTSVDKGSQGRVRSLLWVRLDLATILRRQGMEDEALELFDELVRPIDSDDGDTWNYLCSPADWKTAEHALRLVRDRKSNEADRLLVAHGLKWMRQKDFWILNGSPPADTSCMKRP